MIKSLIISIWAILVTAGVVFAASFLNSDTPDDKPAPVALVDHRTNTMSAALFENGRVIGHFTTRLRYQIPDGAVDPDVVPVEQIIMDGLFEVIHKIKPKELAKFKEAELAVMSKKLAQLLNNRSTPIPITNVRFDSARLMLKSVIR